MSDNETNDPITPGDALQNVLAVSGMYENWFLDYASYVILDRAVPYVDDGLKPVQRRILHAMKEMDDGRYNKVANIIGQTMQYHPHGDAAIGEAIVNMGQKDLLIDTQGNWGNIYTGDGAAAPRYIEARLSPLALEIAFNAKTTKWQLSYDGRKNEPVTLPMKFPLVLAHGVEGIAVGLSTKILPHNFTEICKAAISYLKGRSFELYPDFPTGGQLDVDGYNWGKRGGRVRSRAKVVELDKKTLVITELPFGQTTQSLIDSILKANEKGKIKIRKIDDNTARNVEIVLHLATGSNPDVVIGQLYAFTACESPISPNCCVIVEDQPMFTDVREVLKTSTDHTKDLLRMELEIKQSELEDKWHMSSLEKIFIENRIYRDIEEEETWEGVLTAIDKGLDPFKHLLFREVTRDDILRLTEIKIKRISKFDTFKAEEFIKELENELEQVKHDLAHLVEYTINWFQHLLDKYGKNYPRLTEIRTFDQINAAQVVLASHKLYVNKAEGFVGIGNSLKKDEFVADCSDIDDVIVFLENGTMKVVKAADKVFVGKNIIHCAVWKRNDERTTYHMVYTEKKDPWTFVKRFHVSGVTRDKEYVLTKSGKPGKVLYFSANPNGESEKLIVKMKPGNNLRKTVFDIDLGEMGIKGRAAGGYLVTKFPVHKIEFKSKGAPTLGGIDVFYDENVKRLNTDGLGQKVGNFQGDDRILVLYEDGGYELTTWELTNRYEGKGKILELTKCTPDLVVSAVHSDGATGRNFVKRFRIETSTVDQKFSYINESEGSKLLFATTKPGAVVSLKFTRKNAEDEELNLESFIDVKGWKAIGNKLSDEKIRKVEMVRWSEPEKPLVEDSTSEERDEEADEETVMPENLPPADIPFEIVDTRAEEEEPKEKGPGDEGWKPTLF
jgi:topoisomerase-4 subunit A